MFFKKKNKDQICSPCKGTYITMENIDDQVFSKGLAGECFAIKPCDSEIYSPIKGEICMIFPSKHAIGIKTKNGKEVIVHVGLDTVTLKGKGFDISCEVGQNVEVGDILLKADFDFIRSNNLSDNVIVIATNFKLATVKKELILVEKGQLIANCE